MRTRNWTHGILGASSALACLLCLGCNSPADSDAIAPSSSKIVSGDPVGNDRGNARIWNMKGPSGTMQPLGSAVMVREGWALTAAHVVRDAAVPINQIRVSVTQVERGSPAQEVYYHPVADLALLRLETPVGIPGYFSPNLEDMLSSVQPAKDSAVRCFGYGQTSGERTREGGTHELHQGVSLVESSPFEFTTKAMRCKGFRLKPAARDQLPIYGDSGGPCYQNGDLSKIIGIISSGKHENGVYNANIIGVRFYRHWVRHTIKDVEKKWALQGWWGGCQWRPVEQAGLNSHSDRPDWCPAGTFLTQIDLDGNRQLSAHDSSVVGAAKCCGLYDVNITGWSSCQWVKIADGGRASHSDRPEWCPAGTFLTQLDLDTDRRLGAHDSPLVGQAKCCAPAGVSNYGWLDCGWVGVEQKGLNSHAQFPDWCPTGTFLTQLDLDTNNDYDAHDSPVIGQAKCCSLRRYY